MKLRELMHKNVEFITGQATIAAAAERMRARKVGSLPVVEHGKLVGILTDRDIVTRVVAAYKDPEQERVHDHMTPGVLHGAEDQDLKEAVKIMMQAHVRRLPVLGHGGTLVGIVTLSDLLRASRTEG